MNFITEYKRGQKGNNKGLYMGKGIEKVSNAIGGIQGSRYYVIASPAKTGKSTLINYGFIIQPYLDALENDIEVEFIYYSLEMDRVSQEFDFASYFLYYDFGIKYIKLPNGAKKDGKNVIPLSSNYLRGRLQDDNNNLIKVSKDVEDALKKTYSKRIVPLFGEYSKNGKLIKKGLIKFIETTNTPKGIKNSLLKHAEKEGTFRFRKNGSTKEIVDYTPDNPKKNTIVLFDHIRKLIISKRGRKDTVDTMSGNFVNLKKLLGYSIAVVVHLNRGLTSTERFRQFGDLLHPTSEDIKDTGNMSEDADYVFTMFNPNDQRYNLKSHFGVKIKDKNDNPIYPDLKTIHLVESRHTEYPQHFRVNMKGNLKSFEKWKEN